MRTVFEPSNSLEGHMLQDLLKQRGISSRVDGAQLQGGVGEIPVSGFVRLVVADEDYEPARAIVDEWESAAVSDPIPEPPNRPATGFFAALIGLALGVAGSYLFFRAPSSTTGIDHNEDGTIDERWFTSTSGSAVKIEVDRNFDGVVDYIYRYDNRGRIDALEADDDFNGSLETRWGYTDGSVTFGEADTNGDSSIDIRFHLKHGILESMEYLVPGSEKPVRIDYFRSARIAFAELDSDRDGQMDVRHRYSDLAEIVATEEIAGPQ